MKYFLDCGYYVGKSLEYYAPFLDDSWNVIVFEPNTSIPVKESFDKFSFKPFWMPVAVWTEDGDVDFRLGGRNDASHLDTIRESTDEKISVPCIDFSQFVDALQDAEVICCSFDIEGAEFPVLRKMIKDGTAQKLTLLDIEFHHRLLIGEDESTASLLRQELESLGVLVKLKLEL